MKETVHQQRTSNAHQTLFNRPLNWRNDISANEKVLARLGVLKTYRPNVSPYKLLIFNYLLVFGCVPSAETRLECITDVELIPSAPNLANTMLSDAFFVSQG